MEARSEPSRKKASAIVVGVGAENGLGAAITRRFGAAGFHIFVAGLTLEKIKRVAESIVECGGSAEPITTDTTNEADVERLFEAAFATRPSIESPAVVVFNAGNNARIPFTGVTATQVEEIWPSAASGDFWLGGRPPVTFCL